MNRFLKDLHKYDTDVLIEMFENGVKDIDSTLGDDSSCYLTIGQVNYIRSLLDRRSIDTSGILNNILGDDE